jgi:hypothetical protein
MRASGVVLLAAAQVSGNIVPPLAPGSRRAQILPAGHCQLTAFDTRVREGRIEILAPAGRSEKKNLCRTAVVHVLSLGVGR